MSKSIKVSDEVFHELQKYQGPRESYSHVIERALAAWRAIDEFHRGELPAPARQPHTIPFEVK